MKQIYLGTTLALMIVNGLDKEVNRILENSKHIIVNERIEYVILNEGFEL